MNLNDHDSRSDVAQFTILRHKGRSRKEREEVSPHPGDSLWSYSNQQVDLLEKGSRSSQLADVAGSIVWSSGEANLESRSFDV